jgi:hypothetical protein
MIFGQTLELKKKDCDNFPRFSERYMWQTIYHDFLKSLSSLYNDINKLILLDISEHTNVQLSLNPIIAPHRQESRPKEFKRFMFKDILCTQNFARI